MLSLMLVLRNARWTQETAGMQSCSPERIPSPEKLAHKLTNVQFFFDREIE